MSAADSGADEKPPVFFRFVVFDEPAPKARPRVTSTGHAYTPAKTRQAEWRIREHVAERVIVPLEGPLFLDVIAYVTPPQMPQKWRGVRQPIKRPDLDNYIKTVLDALNGVAFKDDSQVVRILAEKRYAWNGSPGWCIAIGKHRPEAYLVAGDGGES